VIVLVRHAHAGSREAWDGDDRERPLSGRGRAQAGLLASRLEPLAIGAIHASPYRRCVDTVAPVSAATGVAISTSEELAEGSGADGLLSLISPNGSDTVICSHGDVLDAVVARLASQGVPIDPEVPFAKGASWWLETEGDAVVAASYVPPPT
jgi:phosphohistidine phosphatase SixA